MDTITNKYDLIKYIKIHLKSLSKEDYSAIKNLTLSDIDAFNGYVYFIQAGDHGAIKIGYTDDVNKRLKQLQTGNPYKLEIIKIMEGNYVLERDLHDRFKDDRLEGEWFSPSPQLISFIKDSQMTEKQLPSRDEHLSDFIDNYTEVEIGSYVSSASLYNAYVSYCKKHKVNIHLNNAHFGIAMKRLMPYEIIKKFKKINGQSRNAYINLRLKTCTSDDSMQNSAI